MGIIVCGLNGSGKSTLGKALAKELGFHFIDNEDLYFPKTDPNYIYASPRSRSEVERLLMNEVKAHENFVFAAVKGDYGKDIISLYKYAVSIEVTKEIRILRVKDRAFRKFGERMLKGGDLYESQEAFFNMASSRPEDYVREWVKTLNCPVIQTDGTKPVEENLAFITEQVQL